MSHESSSVTIKSIDQDLAQKTSHMTLAEVFGKNVAHVMALVRKNDEDSYYHIVETAARNDATAAGNGNGDAPTKKRKRAENSGGGDDGEAKTKKQWSEGAKMANRVKKALGSWPADSCPRLRTIVENLLADFAKNKDENVPSLRVALGFIKHYNDGKENDQTDADIQDTISFESEEAAKYAFSDTWKPGDVVVVEKEVVADKKAKKTKAVVAEEEKSPAPTTTTTTTPKKAKKAAVTAVTEEIDDDEDDTPVAPPPAKKAKKAEAKPAAEDSE